MPIRYSLSEKEKEIILTNAWYLYDLLEYYINKYEEEKDKEVCKDDALGSYNIIKELFEDEEEKPHKPTQAEIEQFYADDIYDEMKIGEL